MQSHLVRAPLARIMGITDLIQNDTVKNEIELHDLLKHLLNSADELDTIIKDISDKTTRVNTKS
jgi:signal transduction histidine kinase